MYIWGSRQIKKQFFKEENMLKVEKKNSSHISLVKEYLKIRYSLYGDIFIKTLIKDQYK